MPSALLYHCLAFAMSCTSYFAVRNPKNIACSFVALCTNPAPDVAAETSTRPTLAATVCGGSVADLLRRRLAGLAVDLMRGMLLLPDSVPTATVAISRNDFRSGSDASPVHTSAANSPLAR